MGQEIPRVNASELLSSNLEERFETVEVLMDPNLGGDSLNRLVHKLFYFRKVTLRPSPSTLFHSLEVAGALRERGVPTSVDGLPHSTEPFLVRKTPLTPDRLIKRNVAVLTGKTHPTWNVDGMTAISHVTDFDWEGYLIGRDFPLPDPRTGLIGAILNKTSVVTFHTYGEKLSTGTLYGALGDEEYLVRPNRWMTDVTVVKIREVRGDQVTVLSRELLCRPLGSSFVPLNRQEIFNLLLGLRMRCAGLPPDCYLKF